MVLVGVGEGLSGEVIGAALEVHRRLGPGLLESAYARCLAHEFSLRGVAFEAEVPVTIRYKGLRVDSGGRMDLLVENQLVVELKAIQEVTPVHLSQLLAYLRGAGKPLGLLINFNVPLLKQGIRRVIHTPTR